MTVDAWQWIVIAWLFLVAVALYRRIKFLEESIRVHEQVMAGMFMSLLQAGFSITLVEDFIHGSKETSSKAGAAKRGDRDQTDGSGRPV